MWNAAHNARCVKLRCEVKCGGVELRWRRTWHIQCAVRLWRQMWKMMQCVVMSDVVVWCKVKMWWFNGMWNMLWCEICCIAERCGCGVQQLWMWNRARCGLWLCDVEHVLWDVVAWNGGAEADCSVMWSQILKIWWSEVRCVSTQCPRCGVGHWYVVMWCGMLCNGGVM